MSNIRPEVMDTADWIRREGYGVLIVTGDADFLGDLIVSVDGRNEILSIRPVGWMRPGDQVEVAEETRRVLWRESGGQVEVVRSGPEAIQFLRYGLGSGLD